MSRDFLPPFLAFEIVLRTLFVLAKIFTKFACPRSQRLWTRCQCSQRRRTRCQRSQRRRTRCKRSQRLPGHGVRVTPGKLVLLL